MTTGPELRTGKTLVPGLLAVALFGLMALIVLNTPFGTVGDRPVGFPEDIAIVSEIGYALFDLGALQSGQLAIPETESFLAAFLLIALTLDAALDASLVLAKREEEGEPVAALSSRGAESRSLTPPADRTTVADGGDDVEAEGGGETR
ncbi:hypothetical protein [Natronobacterium gregoryi]|uniref:Uncharacterized protein n=2 Tax=Natronobacterium gregoryi TaxID=44930 RepID=L0AE51_NATGS|nr:hypothetical protein [Natronobacterium gregoryi]AFZ72101.1 hypothetical protein Natgr_0861 [Natronobacterium gregoryi SP2]ELY62868.1 hypothetical protein C490_16943 [Natronobacterium gregoryi SP2]PLK20075.1 hypothetical protein CYV19_11630 [Natronobacterium gregoryi SP2]SFJ58232.1 hypothetical protein SAMN05443661_14214 [Natronobacterium gregoryi]